MGKRHRRSTKSHTADDDEPATKRVKTSPPAPAPVETSSRTLSPSPHLSAKAKGKMRAAETQDANAEIERLRRQLKFKDQMLETQAALLASYKAAVQCNICLETLINPFALNCGHVFCRKDLWDWFTRSGPDDPELPPLATGPDVDPARIRRARRHNLVCPQCRSSVLVAPIPLFAIRELVATTRKADDEAGPDDAAKEDEENKDDTWSGLFPKVEDRDVHRRGARDADDRVRRCIVCNWEIEDGECNGCGAMYSSDSEFDAGSDIQHTDRSEDEGHDSDDDDGFIVGDYPPLRAPSTDSDLEVQPQLRRGNRVVVISSDVEDSDSESDGDPQTLLQRTYAMLTGAAPPAAEASSDEESGSGSEVEEPIVRRPAPANVIESSSDSSSDSSSVMPVQRTRPVITSSSSEEEEGDSD